MLPNIDELVPAGTCHQPFDEHAHINPNRELRVVIVSSDERVLHHIIPRAHRHVVRARHQEAPGVRREFELPDGVAVTAEHGERRPVRPDVPHPDGLVDGGGGDTTVVVLVPIAREDLQIVRGDHHGRTGLTHVPDT